MLNRTASLCMGMLGMLVPEGDFNEFKIAWDKKFNAGGIQLVQCGQAHQCQSKHQNRRHVSQQTYQVHYISLTNGIQSANAELGVELHNMQAINTSIEIKVYNMTSKVSNGNRYQKLDCWSPSRMTEANTLYKNEVQNLSKEVMRCQNAKGLESKYK